VSSWDPLLFCIPPSQSIFYWLPLDPEFLYRILSVNASSNSQSKGRKGLEKPKSLSDWRNSAEKTIKLDIPQVVKHHVEKDGQQPLEMCEDGWTLAKNPDYDMDLEKYAECNQIVIYLAFPSSNHAILDMGCSFLHIFEFQIELSHNTFQILQLYSIQVVELNGTLRPFKHQHMPQVLMSWSYLMLVW